MRSGLTALVVTSPIPSCPDTGLLDVTVDSIRTRLPGVEIVVAADGYHDGACTEDAYEEYLRVIASRYGALIAPEWLHEANLTRLAMRQIETDLMLFVEHDNPLIGPNLPWDGIAAALRSAEANMVRLSMEEFVPAPWRYLYLEPDERIYVEGVPMLRTIQWSTRPYLTRTLWMRNVHDVYVGDEARIFVETVMHAVVANAYNALGEEGWARWRLWTYAPEGDMRRFAHTEGRQGAPTRPVTIAYPGETPEFAPAPVFEGKQ